MPIVTQNQISEIALELLHRSLVLPLTVYRNSDQEYAGPSGGTVTVTVPVPRAAREQSTPGAEIVLDAFDEVATNVTLKHIYDAAPVTDEDATTNITSLARQVLLPQLDAVATKAEDLIAAPMNGVTASSSIKWAAISSIEADRATLLAMRQLLTERGVPSFGRHLAVAPDIATRLLNIPEIVKANERGTSIETPALRDATIGRVYGLDVVESPALTAGSAVAYHSSAFVYGNPPPALPAGMGLTDQRAGNMATVVRNLESGLGLRHVMAFDPRHLQTISVVSTFIGCAAVKDASSGPVKRAVRVTTAS